MKMLKIEPCDFSKFTVSETEAPRLDAHTVPAFVYTALMDAYLRLDAKCAVVYHRARRDRAALELACLIAALMTCVAVAGWMRFR